MLASASDDHTAKLIDFTTGKVIHTDTGNSRCSVFHLTSKRSSMEKIIERSNSILTEIDKSCVIFDGHYISSQTEIQCTLNLLRFSESS